MYLKAVELENFKSFGRKTRIEFRRGFNAISGPNGSGKSNIGDAILFVLGPKSSKTLRAQKLTDLIFNGGKKGRPARYCRVSLIFDNTDRMIPWDADEVVLTRYVKVSDSDPEGYNSYFYINGERARLQDFVDLLTHARISADGYNIVKQGDVTRIVEMGSIERRRILEEVAGITKFDQEIAKAEARRRETEENMRQVETLLNELEARLATLAEDRETALQYLSLQESLRKAEAQLLYKRIKRMRSELEGYVKNAEEMRRAIEDLSRRREELRTRYDELRGRLKEIEERMAAETGGEVASLSRQMDEMRIREAEIKIKIENLEAEVEKYGRQVKEEERRRKELSSGMKRTVRRLREISGALDERERALSEMEAELEKLERAASERSQALRDLRARMDAVTDELERAAEDLQRAELELAALRERLEARYRELADIEERATTYREEMKDARWRLKNIEGLRKKRSKRVDELRRAYHNLKVEEDSLYDERENLDREIHELTRRYEALRAKADQTGTTAAVAAILAARDKGILSGIHGTVEELAVVPEEYELAFQVAAGNRIQSIIVEDDEAAARAIRYLKENNLGRAIFLPLNKMLAGRPRGKAILAAQHKKARGFLKDLIRFDSKYEAAFWYVLGDTVVMEDLDSARRVMGGVRIVTLEGELIEASGAMMGGSVERKRRKRGPSRAELEEIAELLREKSDRKRWVDNRLREIAVEKEKIQRELATISAGDAGDAEHWREVYEKAKRSLNEAEKAIVALKKDIEEMERRAEELKSTVSDLRTKVEGLREEQRALREEMERATPEDLSARIADIRRERESLLEEINALRSEKAAKEAEVTADERQMREIEERLASLRTRMDEAKEQISSLRQEMENIRVQRRKLEEVYSALTVKLEELRREHEKVSRQVAEVQREISEIQANEQAKSSILITLNARIDQIKADLNNLQRELDGMGVEVEEPLPSENKIKESIRDMEARLRAMEPVNMKAIEEYDSLKERVDDLRSDLDRLQSERNDLIRLVRELTERKETEFMRVFNAVNENFMRIYSEMSGGGEACLVLENPEKPLEGGLTIRARPPGKKVARLEALSGGEKSLTALCLIFALQEYDPSPFYFLDEVDMFLDGVNAEVVARMARRHSSNAQVVMVSLRQITLDYADYLIGVTIGPDGISRVFEVKNAHSFEDPAREEVVENA